MTILFTVNIGLIAIDNMIVFKDEASRDGKEFPPRNLTYLLLVNHLLQMIFLRHFYDDKRKVNTGHKWVWGVHFISYSVIIYCYFFTDSVQRDASESSKIWIPLDILLTVLILVYQIFFNFLQRFENLMEAESDEHTHGDEMMAINGSPEAEMEM